MTKGDIERLRNLSGFFRALAELPPILDEVENAEQRVRSADAKYKSEQKRIATLEAEAERLGTACSELQADAKKQAEAVVAEAKSQAAEILAAAKAKALEADKAANEHVIYEQSRAKALAEETAGFDTKLSSKRDELERLEARLAKARETQRRMLAET